MSAQTSTIPVQPNAGWVDIVHESLHEVCDMMLGMKVTRSENQTVKADVTAIVGLAGSLCGLFSIRCSRATAAKLAGKMLGMEVGENDADVLDALGEVCNMVAGSFKSKVPGAAELCMLSVPTTIDGADYRIHPLRGGTCFELFSKCDEAPVQILLHVHQ